MDSCLHHGGIVRSIQGQLQVGEGAVWMGSSLCLMLELFYSQSFSCIAITNNYYFLVNLSIY